MFEGTETPKHLGIQFQKGESLLSTLASLEREFIFALCGFKEKPCVFEY